MFYLTAMENVFSGENINEILNRSLQKTLAQEQKMSETILIAQNCTSTMAKRFAELGPQICLLFECQTS